ncbi:MAG: hypothetical protein ABW061_19965 [Polyangiaceae bacterium]
MFNRKVLTALILAGTTLAPMASYAAPAAAKPAPCVLREHRITGVTQYRVQAHQGRVAVQELRGATVFVQAEPGLTAEWLQLTLGRHLAAMQTMGGMKDCAFDVNDVQVKVTSSGAGFAVNLMARDPSKAEEVLRRARLLVG